MMKNLARLLMGVNIFFLITNTLLLVYGDTPVISVVSAFACLIGLAAAWSMYENAES